MKKEHWDLQFYIISKEIASVFHLKISLSSGNDRKLILTESNKTYTHCSRLLINDMCQTVSVENV